MSQNYKITVQYEGTRYDGWQKQGNTENTIQGKLEQVLSRMAGVPVEVHGSGRTDAGVHAMAQVANFHLPDAWRGSVKSEAKKTGRAEMPSAGHADTQYPAQVWQNAYAVMEYLNRYLPEDIAVTSAEPAPERFHSRLSAVKKVYLYQIETGPKRDVFTRRMQYGLGRELDLASMKKAAGLLTGTHDFKSFCGNRKMKKSTVRTVDSITVHQDPGSSVVALSFVGNGFLQNMVRILTGTLIEVGLGERPWQSVRQVLEAKDRQAAGATAPAEGLCLAGVIYEETDAQERQGASPGVLNDRK